MKKLKGIVLATILSALVFAGCSQSIIEDAVVAPSDTNTTTEIGTAERSITITATTEEKLITFPKESNNAARNIMPDSLDANGLDFYLGNKAKGATFYTFEKVTFTAGASDFVGTIKKTFDLTSYEFKLYALPKDTSVSLKTDNTDDGVLFGKAVFAGFAAVDLRYSKNITFYLSPNSLTGKGSLKVNIVTDWIVPTDYTVTAGVYDLITDKLVSPDPEVPLATGDGNNKLSITNWTADNKPLDAGSYNIKVTFTNSKTSNKYTYPEKLTIMPNRESTGTVTVPYIIGAIPTEPKDFIVGYTDPSSTDLEYYKVVFGWSDTSYCEDEFIVQILNVDGTSFFKNPSSDAEWKALLKSVYNHETEDLTSITSDSLWKYSIDKPILELNKAKLSQFVNAVNSGSAGTESGSLNANNNHITLYLPLQERFVARICASNSDGKSAWVYADLNSATLQTSAVAVGETLSSGLKAQATNTAYTLANVLAFDSGVESINRYKISYNLRGGELIDVDTASPKTGNALPKLITYHSQYTKDANTTPAADDTKNPILAPNSKEGDASASPAVSAKTNSKNTYEDKAGATQTDVYLQLKTSNGYYWSSWNKNSTKIATGNTYPTTPHDTLKDDDNNALKIPNAYTDYKNLSLIAMYSESTPIEAGYVIQDAKAYDLQKDYFAIKISNGTDVTSSYLTESTLSDSTTKAYTFGSTGVSKATFNDGVLIIPETISTILISKSYELTDLTGNGLVYKTLTLSLKEVGGYERISNEPISGDQWNIDITTLPIGKYIITINATASEVANTSFGINYTFFITQ